MQKILSHLMQYAQTLGVDYADIRFKDILTENITVEDGQVTEIARNRSQGYGIRVYSHGSMGFAASNDSSHMEDTLLRAFKIARASRELQAEKIVLSKKESVAGEYETPTVTDPFFVPLSDKLDLLMECDRVMRGQPGVAKAESSLDFRKEEVFFADTEGSENILHQTFYQSSGQVTARSVSESDMQERNYFNRVRAGYEGVLGLDLRGNAERVARECAELIDAPECPSGVFDIILTPRQLFLQIHESVGHPTELDRVFGSEAAFAGSSFVSADYLHTPLQYGSEQVTIVADAFSPLGLGTFGWDDEGVPAQRTVLVEKGMFKGFLTSRDNAAKIGETSHGMGLADGWRNMPIVRMTNINLLPGEFTLDELIAGIEDGLLLDENKSWSIDDKRIHFQFACEIAREIKNGKLTGRIYKNPIYSGKTTEFWGSCDGVCDESHWRIIGVPNCGKGQPLQIMRVAHGSAPARFRNVKVGVADDAR
ncbi:MAG: TldD/PmbA family protein [Clostridiales bacterium]|jgi:TldD protein|nr:TldD/PmbA family protein [Clostridiales bacterium]